jgi:predicted nucleic acid-binding protein
MIVVDSSVWIDYFTGNDTPETDHLDSLLGQELIAIGDLVLAEVLQGFRVPHRGSVNPSPLGDGSVEG